MAKFSNAAILLILAVFVLNVQSEPTCICTRILLPVCGSDGVTYTNACELKCATRTKSDLKQAHEGRCDGDSVIPRKFKPQDDPIEVGSSCFCTREFSPVCGSNGRTYTNPCEFGCAQKQKSDLRILRTGPCEDVTKEL